MKIKEQASKKVLDISKPKPRRTAAATVPSAPPLVIPRRSVMVQTPEPDAPAVAAVEPVKARQVAVKIQPPSPQPALSQSKPAAQPQPAPIAVEPKPAVNPEPAPVAPNPEPKPQLVTSAPSKAVQPATPPLSEAPQAKVAEPPEAPLDVEVPADADVTNDPSTDKKSDKANQDVRKALEDAKRQEEINGYIESEEFFVPINAVARKRSLHRTIALIFLELILGLFLLNLMLDAGVIELLERVPHTNFFDL